MDEVKIPPALADLDQMAKIFGMSKGTVRSIMKTDAKFPKPIVFGPRIRRWRVSEIEKWYFKMTGEKPAEGQPKKKRKYNRKPKDVEPAKRSISRLKRDAKDNAKAVQDHKMTVYTEITAMLLGMGDDIWLSSGRIKKPVAEGIKGVLGKSVEEGGLGVSKAGAKRYWENCIAIVRCIRRDHPDYTKSHSTPDKILDLFIGLNITKEAHIVAEFVNTREVSKAQSLAEKVVGKFNVKRSVKTGQFGKVNKDSIFVEGLDDDELAEFEDHFRALKEVRAIQRVKAAEVSKVKETMDALVSKLE